MRSYVILFVFPTGVLRKVYTTYLLSSKLYGLSRIELKETITIICCIIFSLLFFPLGFKGVLATYLHYSPHIFPTGFLEEFSACNIHMMN